MYEIAAWELYKSTNITIKDTVILPLLFSVLIFCSENVKNSHLDVHRQYGDQFGTLYLCESTLTGR